MIRRAAISAIVAVSLLSACGSDSDSDSDKPSDPVTTAAAAAPSAAAPAATETTAAQTTATTPAEPALPKVTRKQRTQCHALLGRMVKDMDALDAVSSVKSGFTTYKAALAKTQTSFDHIKINEQTQDSDNPNWCTEYAYTGAQQALYHYVAANDILAKCDQAKSCDTTRVTSDLRAHWTAARNDLDRADVWFKD